MYPQFDERDTGILSERYKAYLERDGARVGDWVEMPDGEMRRFTHDWGDGLQTTCKGSNFGGGSFYLGRGYVSYSGALDQIIPRSKLIDTGTLKKAPVWFFHHDQQRAHNGVHTETPFRVFKAIE